MHRILEIRRVFLGPSLLTRNLACFAADRLPAKYLSLDITIIGEEEIFTTRALPFSGTLHDPEPPGPSSDRTGIQGRKARQAGKKTGRILEKQLD